MSRRTRTLTKSIRLGSGKVVPAGTTLRFGLENKAYYAGEEVEEELIPEEALETEYDTLDASFDEASEAINELADKAIEGDDEALSELAELAKETADAMQDLIDKSDSTKAAIEDGFGDQDVEELETLKAALDEACDKLETAQETGDAALIEDAVEQYRSIMQK